MVRLIAGIVFIFWGVADIFRLSLPGILGRRSAARGNEHAEQRRIWQRWLGVLEMILGVCELLLYFYTDSATVTNISFTILALAAVCILGPYYSWRREQKESGSGDTDDTQEH